MRRHYFIFVVLALLAVAIVSLPAGAQNQLSPQEILNDVRTSGGSSITVRESDQEALNAVHDASNHALRVYVSGETVYETVPIEWALNGSAPPDTLAVYTRGNGSVTARAFASDQTEDVVIPWDAPTDCDASSGIYYQVVFLVTSSTAPSSEGVSFDLSGYSAGTGDSISGTFGTAVETKVTGMSHAQYDLVVTDWSDAVTVTNLAAGEVAFLKLERDHDDGDDDYGQDVGVIAVRIKYSRTTQ